MTRVSHYYFGIEDQLVITVVRQDVPSLMVRLREMLAHIDGEYPPP